MFRRTLLISLLAFSLALNFATVLTLSFSWWKGQAQAADITVGQIPIKKFLQQDLNLDRDRAAELLRMIDQKRPRMEELRLLLNATRAEMLGLFSDPSLDWSPVNDKLEAISRIQSEIRYETLRTIMQIAESLSSEDRKRFGAYLQARACACAALGTGCGGGPCGDFKADR